MGKKITELGIAMEDPDEWTRVAMKMSYKFLKDEGISAWATWVALNCCFDQRLAYFLIDSCAEARCGLSMASNASGARCGTRAKR